MKRVIVTGGAGFIGSAFIWKLNREGVDDILVVDSLGTGEKWRNLAGLRFSDYLHKSEFLRRIDAGTLSFSPEAVVHMGACSSTAERDADYLMENNTRFTRTLAQWAVQRKRRFLYASSAATYGNGEAGFSDRTDLIRLRPMNMYGYSKHAFDLHAERTGLLGKIVGLKFFNVFGPNEYHKGDMASVVFKACRQIAETGRVRLFRSHRVECAHGEQSRDFIYVKDCIDVMWWLLTHGDVNGLFNLGTGRARTWNDLAKAVFAALRCRPEIEYIPMPEPIRETYQYHTRASMASLRATGCPLTFRSMEEAVHDYVANHLQAQDRYLCSASRNVRAVESRGADAGINDPGVKVPP
ncbi:ADP-glyceromanno-heptose 6-epimerase [Syntrophobacter fumaroxidans]|uniref:ADP-L-glycero-D-manno-heptose-6-epimerase n=1 Tax=Syntrophobacter fumaroxidans (strain DSM 10017 / MPOB) TaxID=335543 RepID=A0LLX4_SYNFM|nr:ADP-glyceromanno-heptose 6-epimerase [Syntrophobacter fumaroxidans]ABK18426.1 ADP-glyceromanno-heptose 6-epimerase precursor [Syntrophobacter fumaroxidans MPOB]